MYVHMYKNTHVQHSCSIKKVKSKMKVLGSIQVQILLLILDMDTLNLLANLCLQLLRISFRKHQIKDKGTMLFSMANIGFSGDKRRVILSFMVSSGQILSSSDIVGRSNYSYFRTLNSNMKALGYSQYQPRALLVIKGTCP